MDILLNAGANSSPLNWKVVAKDALHAAAEGGHYAVVELLADRGYTFDYDPDLVLRRRVRYNPLSEWGEFHSEHFKDSSETINFKERLKTKFRTKLPANYALKASVLSGSLKTVSLLLERARGIFADC